MLELKKERAEKILLENKMKEQEVFSLFEQERLKKELEKLEREVNSKNNELISRALFMANRNKFIVELMQTISETNDYSENPDLKKISQKLNEQINANNERESFFAYFQQYNVSFIEALKKRHNNLTINEVRLLCLIYMDLNMKEIASLLNLSAEYCKKRKHQIAHKIGLEHTSLLYNYLFDLSMHSKSMICNKSIYYSEKVYQHYRLNKPAGFTSCLRVYYMGKLLLTYFKIFFTFITFPLSAIRTKYTPSAKLLIS